MRKLFSVLLLVLTFAVGHAQVQKAPAYPLITRNTYFSIWSFSDTLTAQPTKHWTGKEQSLLGFINVDGDTYRFMGKSPAVYKTILPASDEEAYECKYTETQPAAGWGELNFNDSNWQTGAAPFTDDKAQAKTLWKSKDIWVRRTFNLDNTSFDKLMLKIQHDDNVEVYLNGVRIFGKTGWTSDFIMVPVNDAAKAKLKKGNNIIAIHCANTAGGSWLDFGLQDQEKVKTDNSVKVAVQTGRDMNATQTAYKFRCGKADLLVTFTSPLVITDMDLFPRPVSYITYHVRSNDGQSHNVKVFLGASTDIAVNKPWQQVAAETYINNKMSILRAGTIEQPILKKKGDDLRIDWGYLHVAVPKADNDVQYITPAKDITDPFAEQILTGKDTVRGKQLSLNTIMQFGSVGSSYVQRYVEVAYDELFAVEFFKFQLKPWWSWDGTTVLNRSMERELNKASDDYAVVMGKCDQFNKMIYNDALRAGGNKYAALCVMAFRQSVAAHLLTKSPHGDILFLSKENFSNGSINTVDVTYP
ncbi:MAG TPA: DUF5127 domain-containing protein, partial [Mucilaginibacter sp.]|nr:DUF5127 domain-containing protein [Mucilaginibacter sp.]